MLFKKLFFIVTLCLLLPTLLMAQASRHLTGLNTPASLEVYNDWLYFTEWEWKNGRILRIDLNEDSPDIDTVMTNLETPIGPVFYKDFLFVSQFNLGIITKIDLTQSPPVASEFLSGIKGARDLLVYKDTLYYTVEEDDRLMRISLVHTNSVPELVVDNIGRPWDMTLNNSDLYISLIDENSIVKIDLSDSVYSIVDVITNLEIPTGLFIRDKELFYIEEIEERVCRLDLNMQEPHCVELWRDKTAGFVDLVEHNNNLYVTETFLGNILKLELGYDAITESNNTQAISLYPNPCSHYLYVQGLSKTLSYKILTPEGKEVQSGQSLFKGLIPLSNLSPGSYLLKLDDGRSRPFSKR